MKTVVCGLKKTGFVLLNAWLAFHVFAIFISPATMPPASPLLVDAARCALPYNQALFLNHGYHFFAPDPGASTLISYEIPRPGDAPIKGRFPDPAISPRLLYHRYFMLAENIWGFPESTQDEVFRAYARHFSQQHGSETIALNVVSHDPSSIARIQAGGKLSDPETFAEEPHGFYDFSQPAPARESKAQPVHEVELQLQPVHVDQVVGAGLGVQRVFVARGAAREVRALAGVRAGQRAPGNAVGVAVLFLTFLRSLRSFLLAVFPALVGILFATTSGLIVLGHFDGLTMAFGAALIGVAIDYSIHVLNHHALATEKDFIHTWSDQLRLGAISPFAPCTFAGIENHAEVGEADTLILITTAASCDTTALTDSDIRLLQP